MESPTLGPAPRRPLILLIVGALCGAGLAAAGLTASADGDGLPAGVVARVNGEPIRSEDYTRLVQALANDKRDPVTEDDRRRMLNLLIDEELLVQRGLSLGLARHDRRVRGDLISAVVDGIVSDAGERPAGDDELRAFFDANRDFFAGPGRMRVRQVFVRTTTPSDPAALARATRATERLRAGEAFAAVTDELGDRPLSPLPETALPPAKLRDYLGPTALRAALELDVGAISDPIRSGTGYHVLQVVERLPDSEPVFEDIRPRVVAEQRRRAGEQGLRAYVDELRANADIAVVEPPP